MISGIQSSMGGGWLSLAAMNDFKLSQALSSRPNSVTSPVKPVTKPGGDLSESSAEFLKEYQSQLTELKKQAQSLSQNTAGNVLETLSVSSDNSAVLDVSARYSIASPMDYTVEVKQLARSQVNVTGAVKADEAPTISGSFVLETEAGSYSFDIDASEASSNREVFEAIASEINRLDTGVTAQVTLDGGKVALALSGNETGEESKFSVSGDFAEKTGLDQVTQSARDAVYTVDKDGDSLGAMEYTSSSNTVSIGGYRLEAELKKTGTARIETGIDVEKVADQLGALVEQYNKTVSFLDKNSDSGIGVLQQLRRMIQPPTSSRSMEKVGVTVAADGRYSFDRDVFKKAMEKNPSLTRDIVGGSNGIAQGMQKDAEAGLKTPSASLVESPLSSSQQRPGGMTYNTEAISMMSAYSRSGAYNMLNYYAVGAMMNFYI